MDELDDLEVYNGDTEHDMWGDFTYQENTDELPDLFDDPVEFLHNWKYTTKRGEFLGFN